MSPKKCNCLLMNAVMLLFFIFFFVCLPSLCVVAEGSRPLHEHQTGSPSSSSSSFFHGFMFSKAYSGPSRRGAGHWVVFVLSLLFLFILFSLFFFLGYVLESLFGFTFFLFYCLDWKLSIHWVWWRNTKL